MGGLGMPEDRIEKNKTGKPVVGVRDAWEMQDGWSGMMRGGFSLKQGPFH